MAIYHLTAKTGSSAKGQSAAAKSDYLTRQGKYENRAGDDKVLFSGSFNMPVFASAEPRQFWKAADQYERANARLFKELEFALPVELSTKEHANLIGEFVSKIFDGEAHPMTIAIHAGRGTNPHCHLMFSERVNDGLERSPRQFFKRANKKTPQSGGALKADCSKKWWLNRAREEWANCVNQRLDSLNLPRISHLSLEAQGIERAPQIHTGVRTANAAKKNRTTKRTKKIEERNELIALQAEIPRLNAQIQALEIEVRNPRKTPLQLEIERIFMLKQQELIAQLHADGVPQQQAKNMLRLDQTRLYIESKREAVENLNGPARPTTERKSAAGTLSSSRGDKKEQLSDQEQDNYNPPTPSM